MCAVKLIQPVENKKQSARLTHEIVIIAYLQRYTARAELSLKKKVRFIFVVFGHIENAIQTTFTSLTIFCTN